jgi:hypothetical protein
MSGANFGSHGGGDAKDFSNTEKGSREGEFLDSASAFRASAISLFARCGYVATDAWLYFSTFEANPTYTNLPNSLPVEYFLIMSGVVPYEDDGDTLQHPTLRIFKKTRIDKPLGRDYIVEDVILDEDTDAQYLMDPIFFFDPDVPEGTSEEDIEVAQELHDLSPRLTIPSLEDGDITFLLPLQSFTPNAFVLRDNPDTGGKDMILPFGHHTNIDDAIYAIAKASEMLEVCMALDPDYSGEYTDD